MTTNLPVRRFFGSFVFASVLAGIAGSSRDAVVLAEGVESASPVLNLRLGGADRLPLLTKLALQNEVESIWRESHVRMRWLGDKGETVATPALTMLVTPRAVASCCADRPRWTVGELLRFEGAGAIAVASITGAERVVDESQQFGLIDGPAFSEHRLGLVLGRALAHEIGHYVLQTNTHAQYGLMRENIDAREFADLRADSFHLDREAHAYLAALATRGALFASTGRETFSYATP